MYYEYVQCSLRKTIHLNEVTELNAILGTAYLQLAIIVRSLFDNTHCADSTKFHEFVTATPFLTISLLANKQTRVLVYSYSPCTLKK